MEQQTKKNNRQKLCLIFSLILLVFSLSSRATVMTVNNAGAGQYADLNTAYIAANVGDTLLISGSANEYSITGNWAKNLVVIGSGFNSPKQVFKEVKFGPNSFTTTSGSRFLGIHFINQFIFGASLDSLYFESCRFEETVGASSTMTVTSLSFVNCLFRYFGAGASIPNIDFSVIHANSVLFSHCIFNGSIIGSNNTRVFDVTFDHCVFLRQNNFLLLVYNAVVSNSIIYNSSVLGTVYNSAFNNNLSRLNISNGWALNGNTSTHDTDAVDPLFVNVPFLSNYATTWDFHLQNGSPAKGWDSNGSDAGLHDITSSFDEAGEPQNIPVIRQMILQTATVPQNGSVTVKVRSTKSR
ncbi:MAG TPA: hypothetical protein PLI68_00480 [Bacteroidia bacterium]|nr:hypothetical protein [Bacteroidia bacterium]